VIGGGNVATDNARSSRRFGADVDMVYRRTKEEMPAREEEFDGCVEEGVNIRYLLAPKRIEAGHNGSRLQITYSRMELGEPDASGRRRPMDTGEEVTEGVDLVVAAVGQHPQRFEGFGVQVDKKGRITVRADSMLSSRPGVYAGGDCVLGPSTLIESIAQGRVAAAAMDKQLGGDGDIEEKLFQEEWATNPRIGREDGFNKQRKFHPIMLAAEQRHGWDEVEMGFDDATARAEASRCLKCNLAANIEDMVLPPEAWLEFNAATVAGVPTDSCVFQLLDGDKKVLLIRGVENLREGLEAMLDKADIARFFIYEDAPFFSQRENQLVQAYMQQYGGMPPGVGADEMDDLF
jgi:hypothetical protein